MPDTLQVASALDGERASPLDLVRFQRTRLPSHDLEGVNARQWAAAVCGAEVDHCEREFWRIAHRLGLAHCFDRHGCPTVHLGAAWPHERAAGVVLNWLSHWRTEDNLIADSIGQGMLRRDRPYMRALFARRCKLKAGFRAALAQYKSERTEIQQRSAA